MILGVEIAKIQARVHMEETQRRATTSEMPAVELFSIAR